MDQQNQQKGRSNGSSDGNGKTRKPNKNRQRARRDFEHNAPLIPISTLFSDFQLTQQNNISIELDPSLLDRVSQPYIDKASDFTVANNIDYEETERDYVASTYALVGMTMVRKLIKSAPGSVKPHLSFFKFIGDSELWAPPALVTVFDNLGKLSQDQFTVRIEYLEQDIVRNALRICKAMSRHSQFSGKYAPIAGTTWEDLDVETILYPSNASSRWLKEVGKELLSDTAYNTFPATSSQLIKKGSLKESRFQSEQPFQFCGWQQAELLKSLTLSLGSKHSTSTFLMFGFLLPQGFSRYGIRFTLSDQLQPWPRLNPGSGTPLLQMSLLRMWFVMLVFELCERT